MQIPADVEASIRELIASGAYSNEEEVVRAALAALNKHLQPEAPASVCDELVEQSIAAHRPAESEINSDLVRLVAKVAAKAYKAGIHTFAAYVEVFIQRFGEEETKRLAPYIERTWSDLGKIAKGRVDVAGSVVQLVKANEASNSPHSHEVPLRNSREWQMALENMEQMKPRFLAMLLRDGGLADVLERCVSNYFRALERLRAVQPNEPLINHLELLQSEILTPVNPNWQDEKPLTSEEKKILKAFRKL